MPRPQNQRGLRLIQAVPQSALRAKRRMGNQPRRTAHRIPLCTLSRVSLGAAEIDFRRLSCEPAPGGQGQSPVPKTVTVQYTLAFESHQVRDVRVVNRITC